MTTRNRHKYKLTSCFCRTCNYPNKMPNFCAVVGCGRRGDRDRNSFFRLPCIPKRGTDTTFVNLRTKRRMKWILALRRADLTETKLKYTVVCDRHFISGRPASNYDIENPDWVPSINMGYPANPQKSTYISPHIEYLRKSVVNHNKSNKTANSNQSSLSLDIENIADQNSNVSELTESDNITYQNTSIDIELEINPPEESTIPTEDIAPEEFVAHDKMITLNKISANKDINSSTETTTNKPILTQFSSNKNELYQKMSSKIVQTDLTMTDLDNIADAFKASIIEVNQLKAKLKSFTEDILHINEIYC